MTEEFIGCIEEELKEIEKVCQTLFIIIMRYQNGFLY